DAPASGTEVTLTAPLKIGRAEIAPAAGTRVRTLLAHGLPGGVVFAGPAHLRYRVEDRFSVPMAERNLRWFPAFKLTRAGQELEIGADLAGAVVWGWGLGEAGGETTGGRAPRR